MRFLRIHLTQHLIIPRKYYFPTLDFQTSKLTTLRSFQLHLLLKLIHPIWPNLTAVSNWMHSLSEFHSRGYEFSCSKNLWNPVSLIYSLAVVIFNRTFGTARPSMVPRQWIFINSLFSIRVPWIHCSGRTFIYFISYWLY